MTTDRGELLMTRVHDEATGRQLVRIHQAAPRVLVSPEMLDKMTAGLCQPWASVTGERLDVVTLADDYGQRFVYRLGEYDELYDAFWMEWPD